MDAAAEVRKAVLRRAIAPEFQPLVPGYGQNSDNGNKPERMSKSKTLPDLPDSKASNSPNSPSVPNDPRWKLKRVTGGHYGWIWDVAVDRSNEWFATASADHMIKIWNLATGHLRLTLTGHTLAVRALSISEAHPYLFSGGEDKALKCWDLETNRVVRDYHGHLSGIYSVVVNHHLNLVVSAGRDAAVRVWDMRTRAPVFILQGHSGPVQCLSTPPSGIPTIASGSEDRTIKLWDLRQGKATRTLTHHSRGIRGISYHPREASFASAGYDAVRQFTLDGEFLGNLVTDVESNCISISGDNAVIGCSDGSLRWLDWQRGGELFKATAPAAPGTVQGDQGIICGKFDYSGSRFITGGLDKMIKVWGPNE